MTTTTLTKPIAEKASTGITWLALISVVLGHLSVDMQTGSITVLLPMLLKTFSLDYTSAAAIMSVKNLL